MWPNHPIFWGLINLTMSAPLKWRLTSALQRTLQVSSSARSGPNIFLKVCTARIISTWYFVYFIKYFVILNLFNINISILGPYYVLIYTYFFFVFGATAPQWARASSFTRFLDHTQRRITTGRTPLDEWSVRRRNLYLTTHNTRKRQTSMTPVRFEPTISAGERQQTYALDRAATGTGIYIYIYIYIYIWIMSHVESYCLYSVLLSNMFVSYLKTANGIKLKSM
jgi:hypothetical protein